MRGIPPSIAVEVGSEPQLVESSTSRSTVRLGNAVVHFHGSVAERRSLVHALARDLGIDLFSTSTPT